MNVSTKSLCEWLREHSSGAYRLAAHAATVIEDLEQENARLSAEQAARTSSSSSSPIEWRTDDTLKFVRQEYLSSENYETLRDGGAISLKKRQLTNLFNGLFEHLAGMGLFASPVPAVVPPSAPAPSTDAAQNAAILAWWEGKRPFGWREQEHIDEPQAYCTGGEKALALIAVELAKAKQTHAG